MKKLREKWFKSMLTVALMIALVMGAVLVSGVVITARASEVPEPQETYNSENVWGGTLVLDTNTVVGLSDINVDNPNGSAIRISGNATVRLVISGSVHLTGSADFSAGIEVEQGSTLHLYGMEGSSLTVNGGKYGAGIGGVGFDSSSGENPSAGAIVIHSGTIVAKGGYRGAGIGSGYHQSASEIKIYGGSVTATGVEGGAGIGSGYGTSGGASDMKRVGFYNGGNITISGGTVSATGGQFAAGIGGGYGASSGEIVIDGKADVTATGNCGGAGIGTGRGTNMEARYDADHSHLSVTIGGNAKVTAIAEEDTRVGQNPASGAAIGLGRGWNPCGMIRIEGNASVSAEAKKYAAAIGGSLLVKKGISSDYVPTSSDMAAPTISIDSTARVSAKNDGTVPAVNGDQMHSRSWPVTFIVANGAWNDGSVESITVSAEGYEGEGYAVKLTADQIPAVGTKPNDTYKAGSWDTTPSADTAITADTTYIYTYAQKDTISRTVTFKVVNGSWDDETATDKTVTLTGYEGDTLKLAANQIPAVGTKPNDTYKAGSWNVTPSADTEITADTTYTYTYAQKDAISQTVTFKVVNGSWNDETTADKTVTLTGYEGDTLKLAASQIPAVGDKPGTNYKAGSWDVMPSADTAITAATTYTYTYVAKEAAVVTKAPEGKTLTYNGQEQALVTAGEATGGEMQYALGNETEATQPYTTTIPTATNAGTYSIWYMAKGDANHADSAPAGPVTVVIASRAAAEYTLTVRYVYGDGTQAAEPHTEKLTEGSPYSVSSPAIAGFTPDAASVSGVVGAADVNVTVTYTANPVADRTGKIELHGLEAVPAELTGIYGSLQQLKQAMLLRMTINRMPVVADQTVFYDVELLVSLDGGITWTRATEENFPAAGLKVILPYPEGTNAADFDFSVSHMFTVTSARLGTKAGEIETPAVNLRAEGIQVTLRGLSPVAVSWAKKETPAPTPTVTPAPADVPKTGDSANPALWIVMVLAGAAVIGALLIRSKKKHHR